MKQLFLIFVALLVFVGALVAPSFAQPRAVASVYQSKLVCPTCRAEKKKSTVTLSPCVSEPGDPREIARYWDEKGVLHMHDRNRISCKAHCSNNHGFEHSYRNRCPAKKCKYGQSTGITHSDITHSPVRISWIADIVIEDGSVRHVPVYSHGYGERPQ